MNRNHYDTDVTTWSPDGKLHQVNYAEQSVRQGSCSLGIRSDTHAVLAAVRRSTNALASSQKKIFKIDDHLGIAISGLTADARVLATYMRTECLNHKYLYNAPIVSGRLVSDIADKHQAKTQASWKRPYGVGLLVVGVDKDGPHLYQTSPAGFLYELQAMAIGERDQAAKTYLEGQLTSFPSANRSELIMHALKALKSAAHDDTPLSAENTALAVVGVDESFTVIE
eukprot:CAMPEP_0118804866 /NCGR_PEP_ID=MMETSP1161-20130426/24873_1 /TAXON_ID=249345 /ORGANISM="Picochlorum oklahomensis, Strain CCMP2329" /LENGTH=225 /DNA_ID=CAMNT_0006733699 /DNA_START=138 /DNA_END=812 /DNA_ORIENTATION=+